MGSTTTGEMFTQDQYDRMSADQREELDLVRLTPDESRLLQPMTTQQRKQYLKSKKTHRAANKRERQNRRKARAAR